jgi:hypothetical protein
MGLGWLVGALLQAAGDLSFDAPAHDLIHPDELKARFRSREDAGPYDVRAEMFRLWTGKGAELGPAWGILVFINADDGASLPAGLEALLEKRKLVGVSPYRAGNGRNIFDRFRLAIDAAVQLQKRHRLDGSRIYVSGFSGGGRVASMLGVAYADLFAGAMPLCGVNFYTDIPSEPGRHWGRGYVPVDEALTIAKAKNRYVLVTGEKDFNLKNTRAVHDLGFRKEGFKKTLLLEVPGLAHGPPPAEWLDRGLEFLDRR